MRVLAHDLEVPAFTRPGDRGVTQLTAGTKLAFVRDLDPLYALYAMGTVAQPLFVVVPKNELVAQAANPISFEEFSELFDPEVGGDIGEFEEQQPRTREEYAERYRRQKGLAEGESPKERRPVGEYPTTVIVPPKLFPSEMNEAFAGETSRPLDPEGRFLFNVKTQKVGKKTPGAIKTLERGTPSRPGPKYFIPTQYTLFDTSNGKAIPVQSLGEAFETMNKIKNQEPPLEAWTPDVSEAVPYSGMFIQRTETPEGARYNVLHKDKGDTPINPEPFLQDWEAKHWIDEQYAKLKPKAT